MSMYQRLNDHDSGYIPPTGDGMGGNPPATNIYANPPGHQIQNQYQYPTLSDIPVASPVNMSAIPAALTINAPSLPPLATALPQTQHNPDLALALPVAGVATSSSIHKSRVSCGFKSFITVYLFLIMALFAYWSLLIFDIDFRRQDNPFAPMTPEQTKEFIDDYLPYGLAFTSMCILLVVTGLVIRRPKHIELTGNSIVLHKQCTSSSIAYDRVSTIEYVPQTCCWFNSACTFPRGMFTAWNDNVFIRSHDCGQSILFSPADSKQLFREILASNLANRVISRPRDL